MKTDTIAAIREAAERITYVASWRYADQVEGHAKEILRLLDEVEKPCAFCDFSGKNTAFEVWFLHKTFDDGTHKQLMNANYCPGCGRRIEKEAPHD